MLFRLRSIVERVHDIQDMIGQFAASTVGTATVEGIGHIGNAGAALNIILMSQRHFLPFLFARLVNQYLAAKAIGIRHLHRAFGAVNLNAWHMMAIDIKTGDDGTDSTLGEIHYTGNVSRHLHIYNATILLLAGNCALGKLFWAEPVTRFTGPIRLTRAVR